MTQIFFPFEGGAGTQVSEAYWYLMAQWWMRAGVYTEFPSGSPVGLLVQGLATGREVAINSGAATAYGLFFYNDAPFTLTGFQPNTNPAPRIDIVTLRFDWVNNVVSFWIVQGTPGGGVPTSFLEVTPGTKLDLPLAEVTLNQNYTAIGGAGTSIVDRRVNAGPRFHDLKTGHTGQLDPTQLFSHIGASAENSANIATTSGQWTNLTFDTESPATGTFDPYSMHALSGTAYAFIAPGDGRYLVWAYAAFAQNSVGSRALALVHQNLGYIAFQFLPASTTNFTALTVARVITMTAGTYMSSQVMQDSGGPLNVLGGQNRGPAMGLSYLGPN